LTATLDVELAVFDSSDMHSLMDFVDNQIQRYTNDAEMAIYLAYLRELKTRVKAVWLQVLPGQEAVFTVREQAE
jgi:hypothetical protein